MAACLRSSAAGSLRLCTAPTPVHRAHAFHPVHLPLPRPALRAGECIEFDEGKPTVLWLIPRDRSSKPLTFELETHYTFHHANAYEDAEGRVIIDSVRCPRLELGGTSESETPVPAWEAMEYNDLPYSTLWRHTLEPKTGRASARQLCDRHVDFPSVNPKLSAAQHRYVYAASGGEPGIASPFKGVVKIDTSDAAQHQIWLAQSPTQFVGEAVFAPKKGAAPDAAEDDGYVLLPLLDGERGMNASVLVFRADDLAAGPIATVELDTYLPHGLHGTYVPDLATTREDIAQATKLMNLYARKSREWNKVDGSFTGMGFKSLFQKGVDGR
jgi:carotenoid cleavage dioxygenase-like enzyme